MNVNNIKTFMIGAMVSGLTACEKPVLKKTNNPLLTSTTKEVVDSFAKESKKFSAILNIDALQKIQYHLTFI